MSNSWLEDYVPGYICHLCPTLAGYLRFLNLINFTRLLAVFATTSDPVDLAFLWLMLVSS